jgi:feruloyl esterase
LKTCDRGPTDDCSNLETVETLYVGDIMHPASSRSSLNQMRLGLSSTAIYVVTAFSLAACGGGGDHDTTADSSGTGTTPAVANPQVQCESLNGLSIGASDIGLPTSGASIKSAKFVPAAAQTKDSSGATVLASPEYCQVLGAINPVDPASFTINFAVNLPTSWNKKAMQAGGGGLNGSIPSTTGNPYPQRSDTPTPLAKGYAMYSGDSGHTGDNASFLLNEEATVNFGYASLKKTRDVAFWLIKKRYGSTPEKNYCIGRSNGGRDCMVAVQHEPQDYDGIIAADAVQNYTADMLHNMRIAKSMIDGGWLSEAKVKLLGDASRTACDSADGLVDGRVMHNSACKVDPTPLRCPSGADEGPQCLSDAQLKTVQIIQNPVTPLPLAFGSVYPGFQWQGGEDRQSDGLARMYMGTAAPLKVEASGPAPQPNIGLILGYGRSVVRYYFGRSDSYQTYSFKESDFQPQIAKLSSIIDATNPDLSQFFAHGGKLIFKDNSSDFAQSPLQRLNYIAAMKDVMGAGVVDNNVRWFNGAGAGHFDTDGYGQSDFVGMIENWVEKGVAPSDQVATGVDPTTLQVVRTQPLCLYPAYPRYNGSGDPTVSTSYTCSTT